ncbi:MAG: Type 1 glutamine amidotransferase-like domain-containing protein, partial [Oscillospiraceae bacterium]|nr:Type 1 glutamine amidotransferase-like domain-containing protein [Oscillospiraceae bacterium]
PCLPDSPSLNPANGFVDELRKALPRPCRALFVASDPDNPEHTYRFFNDMPGSFAEIGIPFTRADVLIRENQDQCGELIANADVIFLCGGHVPTQNRFFQDIALRERLAGWDGVIVGVSAGSMNAADVVYVQPEEPGEAVDPNFQRFLPGLGLTLHMILPHYQREKDGWLDGMRLYEDITYPDSVGRRFYAMVDGTYLLGRDGREELRGEAYLVADGALTQIGGENDITLL